MRRHPDKQHPVTAHVAPVGPLAPRAATDQGDIIEPFLVSGGATFFIVAGGPPQFDPRPSGVQLIRSLYVPFGRTGFLKQLRVAPFMPTIFVDPWETSGADNAVTSWRAFQAGGGPARPGGRNGVWETPFGWESYFDASDPDAVIPQWTWQLRLLTGDINKIRATLPPFSVADPASWYLVENIPVPSSAYPAGLPGAAPSGYWTPERMQVLQGDELCTHVIVPQNTTLCLFATWIQDPAQPWAAEVGAEGVVYQAYGAEEFPLLPSFGQLHGYLQAADREDSTENARFGWGG